MIHKEFALLATLTDKYEKHFVPEIMVHRASGGNHDQRKSIYSTQPQRTIALSKPATPPRRSV